MAVTSWDDFIPLIIADVPGCIDFTMKTEVIGAAIEFCRRTRAYRYTSEEFPVLSGVNEYTISLPTGTAIDHVYSFACGSTEIQKTHPTEEATVNRAQTGVPQRYALVSPTKVRLYPIPDADTTAAISCSLIPTRSSTGIDSTIYDWYSETISSGAVYRLVSMPGKAWTNTALADTHLSRFETGVYRALEHNRNTAPFRSTATMF